MHCARTNKMADVNNTNQNVRRSVRNLNMKGDVKFKGKNPSHDELTIEKNELIVNTCPKNHEWFYFDRELIPFRKDELKLPKGSADLSFISSKNIIHVIFIHNLCMQFWNILNLTQFEFEDMCMAFTDNSNSELLAYLHISFLNFIISDNEDRGITYSSHLEKECSYIMWRCMDTFSFVEPLKMFLKSNHESYHLYILISKYKNYPLDVDTNLKIQIVKYLAESFLQTKKISSLLETDNFDELSFQQCYHCHLSYGLNQCENCQLYFHPNCDSSSDSICNLCIKEKPFLSELTFYKPIFIGIDSYGNVYWFYARRLFIELEKSVYCYSSPKDLDTLIIFLQENTEEHEIIEFLSTRIELVNQLQYNVDLVKKMKPENKFSVYDENKITPEVFYLGADRNYENYVNFRQILNLLKNDEAIYYNLFFVMDAPAIFKKLRELPYNPGSEQYNVTYKQLFLEMIKLTLSKFEGYLPSSYLHPLWYHQFPTWLKALKKKV